MKRKLMIVFIISGLLFFTSAVEAKLKVVATYNYIADLVKKIGGDEVKVIALAKGYKDPHFVTPRPSFIAKMRQADLLIMNGGQLEIGWLPPIIRKANNPKINTGSKGLLDLFGFIEACDVPAEVSRAQGDVHPDGNPHYHLNPENILKISEAIKDKLIEADSLHADVYKVKFEKFASEWKVKMAEWKKELEPFKGKNVVQYHKNFCYFLYWAEINKLGTLEPVPGIPPTTRHILEMIDIIKNKGAEFIIHDVYHMKKPSRFVSNKTGVKLVILPHDIGAVNEATDIFSLFEEIVGRLTK